MKKFYEELCAQLWSVVTKRFSEEKQPGWGTWASGCFGDELADCYFEATEDEIALEVRDSYEDLLPWYCIKTVEIDLTVATVGEVQGLAEEFYNAFMAFHDEMGREAFEDAKYFFSDFGGFE